MRLTSGFSQNNSRQRPTLPHTCACSTIGGGRLNFRVRNGNGWNPAPMTTGKLVHQRAADEMLVVRGPTGWNAAISHVSSPCRSSRTIFRNAYTAFLLSSGTPTRRSLFKEQRTTEYPANGSSLEPRFHAGEKRIW